MYRSGRGFFTLYLSWLAWRFLFHNFLPMLIKRLQYSIWSTNCVKTSKKSYASQTIWFPELDIVTAAASYFYFLHLSNTNCSLFEYISIKVGFLFKSDSLWHASEHYPTGIIKFLLFWEILYISMNGILGIVGLTSFREIMPKSVTNYIENWKKNKVIVSQLPRVQKFLLNNCLCVKNVIQHIMRRQLYKWGFLRFYYGFIRNLFFHFKK